MSDFTVINARETFSWVQEVYKEKVEEFMEDPRAALLNRSTMDKMIQIGENLYMDFWNIVEKRYGKILRDDIKEKYETYG